MNCQKLRSPFSVLQKAGLRPTRQRLALATWLFSGCSKHVRAEDVYKASRKMRTGISLATVYNTLNAFTGAGMLRQIVVDGGFVYFDTNPAPHHHMFDEATDCLSDIQNPNFRLSGLPKLPKGKILSRIDVILRIKQKK